MIDLYSSVKGYYGNPSNEPVFLLLIIPFQGTEQADMAFYLASLNRDDVNSQVVGLLYVVGPFW